ncbi:MAG: DUF4331 family protein [Dermatophilaceae bacterium]
MSHHLDSPASRKDPRLNITDTYVFDGARGTVFVMLTNTSLAGAAPRPGFHPEARYEFKIHTDGEAMERRTYRFSFGEWVGGAQSMMVHELTDDNARDDSAQGRVLLTGMTDQTLESHGDVPARAWAGDARDPFYLDLRQLPTVVSHLQNRGPLTYDDWSATDARNSFDGSQVGAIVLEIGSRDPHIRSGRDIAVWSVTKLATDAGGWRQVNRSAIPMVWPLFRAIGGDDDSTAYAADTAAHPAQDLPNDGDRVRTMIAAAASSAGSRDADAYADLVTSRLLPDLLPYRVGTPAAFGFAGFNGRALEDNAPEVMYSLVTNRGVTTGLTSEVASAARSREFPYVVASGR